MFNNFDYRRLLPSRSLDSIDEDGGTGGDDSTMDYGIYEDEESTAQRLAASGDGNNTEGGIGAAIANHPMVVSLCSFLPTLSIKERLLGCATCMLCGYLLSFGSFVRFKDLLFGDPAPIVFHVTLGNVLALAGTCFLSGPTSQVRRMWHESRRVATTMYLGSMFLCLLLLLTPGHFGKGFLLFLLIIFQYIAVTWYCLSYIPFARDVIKRLCRNLVRTSSLEEDG